MNAVVSVLGQDRPGIIATVSRILYETGVNILDINQTVLGNKIFAMTMWADLDGLNVSFSELKQKLDEAGEQMGMEVRIQREEIFNSMFRV